MAAATVTSGAVRPRLGPGAGVVNDAPGVAAGTR